MQTNNGPQKGQLLSLEPVHPPDFRIGVYRWLTKCDRKAVSHQVKGKWETKTPTGTVISCYRLFPPWSWLHVLLIRTRRLVVPERYWRLYVDCQFLDTPHDVLKQMATRCPNCHWPFIWHAGGGESDTFLCLCEETRGPGQEPFDGDFAVKELSRIRRFYASKEGTRRDEI
jgi:hypothetical protein